jgi:hypothetical protein
MGWRTRTHHSDVLDDALSGGRVEIKLTETPDTDPCTQAPIIWRNGDYAAKWISMPGPKIHSQIAR